MLFSVIADIAEGALLWAMVGYVSMVMVGVFTYGSEVIGSDSLVQMLIAQAANGFCTAGAFVFYFTVRYPPDMRLWWHRWGGAVGMTVAAVAVAWGVIPHDIGDPKELLSPPAELPKIIIESLKVFQEDMSFWKMVAAAYAAAAWPGAWIGSDVAFRLQDRSAFLDRFSFYYRSDRLHR